MNKRFTFQFILMSFLLFVAIKGFSANINVGGTISSNTTWNADTVKVYSNVIVNNGVYLHITPGTYVKFMGHYSLSIQGQLRARGTATSRIIFSASNTTVGWSGIRFDNTPTTNAQSYIEYCTITYGKANTGSSEDKMGGAIFVKGTSDLLIRNNIISNNTATYHGGAITCRYGASPTIANNIICNNSANSYGGAIYLYSNALPKMSNNTIANNSASQGGGIYANQSDPYIYSNIITGNQASSNTQLNSGLTLVNYNVIEGGYSGVNYNISPNFVNPTTGKGILYDGVAADWSLQSSSYAIDHGYPYASTVQSFFNVTNFDVYGNFRFDNARVDIGAVEYISSIEACGHITSNTTWYGNVLVNCNVYVDNGKTLTIQPGTKITFTGHYSLTNSGRILAQGTSDNNITFTAWDKTEGWNSINMISNSSSNGTTKFEYCDVTNSKITGSGGAFYIYNSSNIWIRNCKIRNNLASYGGGIYISSCSPYIVSNLIINNEATGYYGGGIYMYGTSSSDHPYIYNNTISRNKALYSGAGLYRSSSINPYLRNNIIWGNEDASGNHAQIDNISPTTGLNVYYCDIEGGYGSTSTNKNADPLFKNATSSAGINGNTNYVNFSISDLSPCVDQGTTYALTNQPSKDIIGRDRIYNSVIDMGAYEEKALLTLSCSNGTSTISSDQAWDASVIEINCDVVIQDGATVTINPGTEVKFNGNYSITVNGAIVAKGTAAEKILFTATNTTTGWDGMEIYASTSNDSTIFDYCRFQYSKRTTATQTNGGGAMTIRSHKVRVSNSGFVNNETSGRGGAIEIYYCHPTIEGCTFALNTGGDGGAIYVFYYKDNPSDPSVIIRNNLIYYNTATYGGGLYFYAPEANVYNNKIVNNTAVYGGGIYYSGNRISDINDNLIANNTATSQGGGLYIDDCKANFINNTIVNNRANNSGGGFYCTNNSDPFLKSTIVYGNYQNSSSFIANQFYLSDILSDPKIYNSDIEGGSSAFLGLGSGVDYSGDYVDVLTGNPSFVSPTTGHGTGYYAASADFSLQQGSICINTGVEDISGLNLPEIDLGGDNRLYNGRIDIGAYESQDDIISPCTINSDLVWDANIVKVNCNVTISNGATLTIKPGTTVLFMGKYSMTVEGAIQAKGNAGNPIHFTASNLTNFTDLSVDQGGWSGIKINSPALSNDSSIFEFCNFSYGKATGSTSFERKGGAIYVFDFHKVAITHCKFSNNAAKSEGGALCIESSNIIFHNNLVVNNHADNTNYGEGGGLRIDDSNIDFKNNTIANNSSRYGGGIFIYSSTSPSFEGSIFYGNQTIGSGYASQIHTLLCTNISFIECDIQGGKTGIGDYYHISTYQGNYNIDPLFVFPTSQYGLSYNGLNASWELSINSPLINTEYITPIVNSLDLSGQPRQVADTLDIGAYEVQMSPRFITEQPVGDAFCVGTPALIKANSSIVAGYQWQKNGVNIIGAVNKKLYIASISHSDTAFYNCIISSNYGSVSTDTVWVGTKVAPSVVSNPSATSACIGSSATFTSTVDGTSPINYQWFNTNGALSGGTNNTFTIVSATANDASTYRLRASNSCGSVFTNGALLTINTVPTLTPITAAADVCENGSNTFTTSATGSTPITYQWYKNGSAIGGATSVSYSISNASISDGATYYCKATNLCGTDQTNQSILTVNAMPSISVQPSSSTVCEGQSYTFSITASGAAPLTYQWYKGGVSIANANNNTYTISSIQSSDATTYYCIVTNSCNSATSSTASLTVNSSPNITSQTSSIDVCSGSAAPFSITASGTAPMTYQWYNSAGSIALATSSTYTIGSTTTSDASNYYCKVTNACGTDWTTSIPLTVQSSPSITSQTPSLSKCEGQSAIFDIQVSGSSPLTYQWKKDGIAISGAVSSSLLISPVSSNDNASYICTATNSCGSVSSTASNLTVNSNVTITSQSSSQTLCEGSSPTLSVTANGTAPITYQWYNNSGLITGATNNTYSINSIDTSDAGNYYCVATNTCTSTSSNAITINVNEAPSIDNNPVSAVVCENYSTVFSVSASGTNPMTYQWYNSSGIISGATGSSYIIPQVVSSDAGTYYVKATNACGTVTSQNASLTVNTPVSITAQSSSSSVCSGASPSLSITAAGTSPINYQWYKDGSAISGATNNSLSLTSVSTSDAANYYVVATNSCNSVPSNTMTLTVNQGPSIVNQPTAQSVCEGTSTQLNVSASGTAPMTYQWYKASSPITGATNNNYIISSASSADAASYYVKVTNSCGNVNSQNASLTVNIPANITAQSTSTAVCGGASPSLTITASGTAPLTYQWYKDGSAISGATNNAYNLTSVDTSDDATYYAIVTNSCNSDQSNPIILTVNESPSIVTQPISSIACSGSSTMLSISSNGTAPLSYQWYKGGTPITGAISNTYIIGSVTSTDAGSYYCKVSNSCATVTSNNASLVVNDPVLITSQSGDSTKCVGDAMMFSISNTGTAPITYQWYHNGNAITGGTSSAYSINAVALANAGDYYCIASNACNSTQSSVKNLVVNTVPAITQQSSDTSICSGNNLTLNVMTSGSSPMSYQWYKGSTAMGGAINNVYPMYQISTSDAATYYCVATNSCGNAQSNNMVITVNSPPSITYQSADSTRCEGESMTFKVTATGTAPLSYQWYNGQTAINGGDTSIYNIANVVPADNGNYHAVITNTCASVSSAYKYLTVHATPQVNLGNDTTFCDGGSVIIGPGYGYYAVWNTGQIASQLNITTTGTYSASVVDQYGCNGLTDTINVNVVLPYANQEICLVTVDSATSKNIIVWEKTPNMGISSFNVYKESNISGVYSLLANRPYDSLSVVLDLASNPTVSAERYAITVVDSCGNESPFSPAHRTMHMTVNKGQNNDWNLIWNAYEGFTPSSYKIYRADTSLNFVNIATVSGSSSYTYLYTDQSAPANVTLYYYVEVVHPNGGCNATKGKTSYNSSRSNRANSGNVNPTSLVPAFFGTPTSGVFPLEVHFFDQSQGTPIEWEWDFGDGSIDSVQNPVHSYTQIGVYSVSLIVKDAGSMNSVAFQNYITVLTTGIAEVDDEFVVKVFPNPYSDKTSIAYALTNQTKVVMEVYTSQGQKVAELINTEQSAGSYKVQFRAADYGFASGVYILRMHVGDQLITKKLIEVK